jgi:hypothetical protein
MRTIMAVLVLLLLAVGAWAADGTVVGYDAASGKLTVKVGDQERVVTLKATTHVHDMDGREIRAKERPAKLKKDVRIELVEKGGKLIEINLK